MFSFTRTIRVKIDWDARIPPYQLLAIVRQLPEPYLCAAKSEGNDKNLYPDIYLLYNGICLPQRTGNGGTERQAHLC